MKPSRSEPGLVVSAAVHAGLLLATLIAFSDTKKFDDAQESVPVDIVTDAQLNQVMKGEKAAKEIKPAQRADKVAEQHETKPLPPLAEAKKDVAAPPPPLKPRLDEPEDKPEAPPPPKRIAALPPTPEPPLRPTPPKAEPPKPEPPKPQPAKAEPPKLEPPKPERAKPAPTPPEREDPEEAEVVKPKPPVRPKPEKEAKETPQPPEKPKPKEEPKPRDEPKKEEAKKETAKPKEAAKEASKQLKVDEVARLLEKKKAAEKGAPSDSDEKKKSDKPPAKPKSGDEAAPKSKFDAANIANLLSHEAPQRRAATGADLTKTASLGAPTASAPRMSPTMQAQIDAYTVEHYRKCWETALSVDAHAYVPQVEFRFTRNGALDGQPRLLNPSANPVERSRGEQALGAVRRCSPMPIPPAFEAYFDYWRVTVLNMTNDM
ncbi:cell envelope biogenesis protein TolA [Methylosinus sp. RM1]|uniref:cell envelope biogenesis protein TolA n=1 Tax=Methylosinus sp. RM1 TaxID=2583817 RepID=UPI001409D567|nr:cell envelope biogenesis protein TolA [Methylosinus sp. RM1]